MSRIIRINEGFTCENCGVQVAPTAEGPSRNHCNKCLYAKHVDLKAPGDRLSDCGGLMKPLDVQVDKKKGEVLIQVCERCGLQMRNKIALDDDRDELVAVCERKIYKV